MREEMNNQNSILEACEKGDVEKVKILLEKGDDIEAKTLYGKTPLMIASCYGNIEVVKLLLEKGADIEAKDYNRITPLSCASRNGHIEVVKLLLEKGSDIEVKGVDGTSSYYHLTERNKKEIDSFLEDIEQRKRMIKPCSF